MSRLVVCPTPIGNLEDVTLRVLAALRDADVVACEDTRHTKVLLERYGVSATLVSYHEHNERARAAELVERTRARVVAADVTPAMLARAQQRFRGRERRVDLVQADAQVPPFRDGAFDVVVWSYLLRYVDDVPATVRALGRLVRPGGTMASLEFGVPKAAWARVSWEAYTRAILPA